LVRYIAQHAKLGVARLEHDPPFMKSSGLADSNNGPVAERLAQLVRNAWRAGERVGAPYGTDAAAIGAGGVPTVVFGPGSVGQAHTADEFIEVGELELGTELYHQIAVTGLR
jgi:acetylornithine deacetylase